MNSINNKYNCMSTSVCKDNTFILSFAKLIGICQIAIFCTKQMMFCLSILFCVYFFSSGSLLAQEVKISRDINIRNDYAYDLFALNGQILFFRDKGFDYYFDVFDKEMNYKRTQEIKLAERRHFIENILASDSTINIVFSYKDQDSFFVKSITYDDKLNVINNQTLIGTTSQIGIGEFRSVFSEDHSKLLLFQIENDKIFQLLFDVKKSLLVTNYEMKIPEYRLKEHFVDAAVSNDGHFMYLFEKNNNSWDKEKHFMRLISCYEDKHVLIDLSCVDLLLSDVKMAIDNGNNRLSIASLWGENNETETEGYVLFSKSFIELSQAALHEITAFYYDDELITDLNGANKKSKKNYLFDFYLKSIVHRVDGGVVLITELQREFTRRNAGLPNFDRSLLPAKGYVDYYHEDLILFSMDSKGALSWRKILFKKQFSQDDEGIYSSFLVMKLPSQLRIIFK